MKRAEQKRAEQKRAEHYPNSRPPTTLRWFALGTLFVAVISGCAVPPPPRTSPQPRKDVVTKQILDAIASETPQKGIELISYYRGQDLLSDNELNADASRAKEAMRSRFVSLLDEKKYEPAIGMLRSLQTLEPGAKNLDGWSLTRLWSALASTYHDQGNNVAALDAFDRIPTLEDLKVDDLAAYGKLGVTYHDRHTVSLVVDQLKSRNADVPKGLPDFLSQTPSPSQMLKGTVTIWVNRGIKVEQGVGLPDSVIGSGFFIDERGYLLTNYHVIESEVDPKYEGYSRLYVRLSGSPEDRIPAKVVGYSRIFDIALLKVEINPPYVFSLTDVRDVPPGTRIYAIGSPGGLESTITSGIISANGRRFLQMGDQIQMDAPVNPGNSGGPLFDEQGQLVGVVFAGIQQFQGVNFAIPSFWLRQFLPDLYQGGEVVPPWIGAAVTETNDGLEVEFVQPSSPAEKIGLQTHDIITGFDGSHPKKIGDFQKQLMMLPADTLVSISWKRDGHDMQGYVIPTQRPFVPAEEALKLLQPEDLFPVLFGMDVDRAPSGPFQKNYVVTNVYPGTPADDLGLTPQDPFTVVGWHVDDKQKIAQLQIVVRAKKAGFMERGVQLTAYLETDNFI